METPLCLLPGLPLVRTSFSHLLLSGWWDSIEAARGSLPLPPPLWPTGSLYPCVLPRRTGSGTQTQAGQSPWDHFLRRHLDCLSSGFCPQRRGSDPSPFPPPPVPCPYLTQWVSLDRPTLPCPCSRKGLSAPVGLVSLPGMLLPDARPPVALGVLGTLEGSAGALV